MKIILVVDDMLMQERLIDALEAVPNLDIVNMVAGALEACKGIQETRPDVVLTGISLRNGSGLDVVRFVKTLGLKIPVIMINDYPFPEIREKSTELGVDYFFHTSTEFGRIVETLRQLAAGEKPLQADENRLE